MRGRGVDREIEEVMECDVSKVGIIEEDAKTESKCMTRIQNSLWEKAKDKKNIYINYISLDSVTYIDQYLTKLTYI